MQICLGPINICSTFPIRKALKEILLILLPYPKPPHPKGITQPCFWKRDTSNYQKTCCNNCHTWGPCKTHKWLPKSPFLMETSWLARVELGCQSVHSKRIESLGILFNVVYSTSRIVPAERKCALCIWSIKRIKEGMTSPSSNQLQDTKDPWGLTNARSKFRLPKKAEEHKPQTVYSRFSLERTSFILPQIFTAKPLICCLQMSWLDLQQGMKESSWNWLEISVIPSNLC